jgi:hypothetical protein
MCSRASGVSRIVYLFVWTHIQGEWAELTARGGMIGRDSMLECSLPKQCVQQLRVLQVLKRRGGRREAVMP